MILLGNSYCENIVITVTKICTDSRQNLGKHATQGHGFTNMYTETISVWNSLGILISKINIFEKIFSILWWESTKSIHAQAKSATYKNLQPRKKQQQQQAAANDGPEDWTFVIIFVYILT